MNNYSHKLKIEIPYLSKCCTALWAQVTLQQAMQALFQLHLLQLAFASPYFLVYNTKCSFRTPSLCNCYFLLLGAWTSSKAHVKTNNSARPFPVSPALAFLSLSPPPGNL